MLQSGQNDLDNNTAWDRDATKALSHQNLESVTSPRCLRNVSTRGKQRAHGFLCALEFCMVSCGDSMLPGRWSWTHGHVKVEKMLSHIASPSVSRIAEDRNRAFFFFIGVVDHVKSNVAQQRDKRSCIYARSVKKKKKDSGNGIMSIRVLTSPEDVLRTSEKFADTFAQAKKGSKRVFKRG